MKETKNYDMLPADMKEQSSEDLLHTAAVTS